MSETFPDLCSNCRLLAPAAYVVTVRLHARIDQDRLFSGLVHVSLQFPELNESLYDEEEETFTLLNDTEQFKLFRCVRYERFEFAWSPSLQVDFDEVGRLLTAIEKGFAVTPINVQLLEVSFYAQCDWRGNHYKVIHQAFYVGTPLSDIFEPDRILQNDLLIRGLLPGDRPAIVRVESDVEEKEVILQRYESDRLSVYVGVADSKNIRPGRSLASVFSDLAPTALTFMRDVVVPKVVQPLDRVLAAEKGRTG